MSSSPTKTASWFFPLTDSRPFFPTRSQSLVFKSTICKCRSPRLARIEIVADHAVLLSQSPNGVSDASSGLPFFASFFSDDSLPPFSSRLGHPTCLVCIRAYQGDSVLPSHRLSASLRLLAADFSFPSLTDGLHRYTFRSSVLPRISRSIFERSRKRRRRSSDRCQREMLGREDVEERCVLFS